MIFSQFNSGMSKRKYYFENDEGDMQEMPDSEDDEYHGSTPKRSRLEGDNMDVVPYYPPDTEFNTRPRDIGRPGAPLWSRVHEGEEYLISPDRINEPFSRTAWKNRFPTYPVKIPRYNPQVEELPDDELVTDQTLLANRFGLGPKQPCRHHHPPSGYCKPATVRGAARSHYVPDWAVARNRASLARFETSHYVAKHKKQPWGHDEGDEVGKFARFIPKRHGAQKFFNDVHARLSKYRGNFGLHRTRIARDHLNSANRWIDQHNDRIHQRRMFLYNKVRGDQPGSARHFQRLHQEWLNVFNSVEHPRGYSTVGERAIRKKIRNLSAAELKDMVDIYIWYRFHAYDMPGLIPI